MSEELFDVVFFGILQAGKDKDMVMQNMAAMFKTETTKLAPYFAGGRKVIKGNINAATAEKYKAALENVGLTIKVEPCEASARKVSPEKVSSQGDTATKSPETSPAAYKSEQSSDTTIDTGDMSVAPVGADVLENPVAVPVQKIDDISAITMAETGADVIKNPVAVVTQEIADISDISMAEVGTDVLDHPRQIIPQKIGDISDISVAEVGSDLIANPEAEEKAKIPDTSGLSLDNEEI